MAQDRSECEAWAQKETGFDPSAPVVMPKEEPQRLLNGKRIEGAPAGAARGAVTGAIGGPLGAGVGAAVGAGAGAHRSEQEYRKDQAQKVEAAREEVQAKVDRYHAVVAACLEGRGYSVR